VGYFSPAFELLFQPGEKNSLSLANECILNQEVKTSSFSWVCSESLTLEN
jgi:hypothetical protein